MLAGHAIDLLPALESNLSEPLRAFRTLRGISGHLLTSEEEGKSACGNEQGRRIPVLEMEEEEIGGDPSSRGRMFCFRIRGRGIRPAVSEGFSG